MPRIAPFHSIAIAIALSSALSSLSACAGGEGGFPSLERRPYETGNPIAAPVTPAPAPALLPAALQARVAALLARHSAAQADFAKALGGVQSIAAQAAGSAPGTESWVNAHLQLSRLDKSRGDSIAVVHEFDSLIAGQGAGDSAYVPLLTDAQKPVVEDVAAQNDAINRLSRLIGE